VGHHSTSHRITSQNRTKQNRTEQNRTEQWNKTGCVFQDLERNRGVPAPAPTATVGALDDSAFSIAAVLFLFFPINFLADETRQSNRAFCPAKCAHL
jgi:hypothetical protein